MSIKLEEFLLFPEDVYGMGNSDEKMWSSGEDITMEHRTVKIELTESNARYGLLALRELNQKLQALAHDDGVEEDERFFHVNDLMEASRDYDNIERESVATFGNKVLEHSHQLL